METKKRYSIKKILLTIMWLAICASVSVLLVAAIRKNDAAPCKSVTIKIIGIEAEEKFVDETDVLRTIETVCGQNPVGKSSGSFNLRKIETELKKSDWIKSAQLFFDNADVLQVKIYEREPVARIFTASGNTFYIDTALKMLPLSEKFSARLPVFTGFPSDNIVLSAADSSLLKEVRDISLAMQKDSFRMAMIDQVDINAQHNFEMIPKIGNQLIVFGNAEDADAKFEKLKLFYKNVLVKTGWSKYSVINVQYKNQVVAKLRGQEDKTADSVRTLQMMQLIAANAARMAEDSVQTIMPDNSNNTTDSSIIQQSIQREDNIEVSNELISNTLQPQSPPVVNKPVTNPLPSAKPQPVKPETTKPVPPKPKSAAAKPVTTKPAATTNSNPVKKPPAAKPNSNTNKPRAVMPVRNDY
jgi:cell division protein FtsQ